MRNFIVTIDGKKYEVEVEEVTSGAVQAAPAPVAQPTAKVEAKPQVQEAPKAAPKAESANVEGTKVEAPMPGMIKALSLAEGTSVKKGDVIMVLEAMKMDNDISAPCDGKVYYKQAKGTNVNTGDLMAVIA